MIVCVFITGPADTSWVGAVCPTEGGRLDGRLGGWLPGPKEGGGVIPRPTDGGPPGEEGCLNLAIVYVSCRNGGLVEMLSVMPRDRVGGRELGWL